MTKEQQQELLDCKSTLAVSQSWLQYRELHLDGQVAALKDVTVPLVIKIKDKAVEFEARRLAATLIEKLIIGDIELSTPGIGKNKKMQYEDFE